MAGGGGEPDLGSGLAVADTGVEVAVCRAGLGAKGAWFREGAASTRDASGRMGGNGSSRWVC